MVEMTPADHGAQAARQDRLRIPPMTSQPEQRDALARLLRAANTTMQLWNEHGLGDDHRVSELAYYEFRDAMKQAVAALEMEG